MEKYNLIFKSLVSKVYMPELNNVPHNLNNVSHKPELVCET